MMPYGKYQEAYNPPDWAYALQGLSGLLSIIGNTGMDWKKQKMEAAERAEALRQSQGEYDFEYGKSEIEGPSRSGDPLYGMSRAEQKFEEESQLRAAKLAEYGAPDKSGGANPWGEGMPSESELKVLEYLGLSPKVQEQYPGYRGLPEDLADEPSITDLINQEKYGYIKDVGYGQYHRETQPQLGGVDADAILSSTNAEIERLVAGLPRLYADQKAQPGDKFTEQEIDIANETIETSIPPNQRRIYDAAEPRFLMALQEGDYDAAIKLYQMTEASFEWPALQNWLRGYWGKMLEVKFQGDIIPPYLPGGEGY